MAGILKSITDYTLLRRLRCNKKLLIRLMQPKVRKILCLKSIRRVKTFIEMGLSIAISTKMLKEEKKGRSRMLNSIGATRVSKRMRPHTKHLKRVNRLYSRDLKLT